MAISIHGKQLTPIANDADAWEGDKFARKEFGETLLESISQLDSPATIGLVGAWGTGKTRFLEMLRAEVAKRGEIFPVYFNAWARGTFRTILLHRSAPKCTFSSLAMTGPRQLKRRSIYGERHAR